MRTRRAPRAARQPLNQVTHQASLLMATPLRRQQLTPNFAVADSALPMFLLLLLLLLLLFLLRLLLLHPHLLRLLLFPSHV